MTSAAYLALACTLLPTLTCAATLSGDLVVTEDIAIADLLVDQVAWLGDERGLVIGGWKEWPSVAQIIVAETGKRTVALERPATPHFALSPSRKELAYWVATGAGWCQLGVVPVAGAPIRYVGPPRRVDEAMHLAWPAEAGICALLQDRDNSRAIALDPISAGERTLLEAEGGQWVRLRRWPGSDPIAVWVSDKKRCFRLSVSGQSEEVTSDFDTDCARPSAIWHSYFDSQGSLVVIGVRDGSLWKVPERLTAACWAPDGETLLCAREDALWVGSPEGKVLRRVPGSYLDKAGPGAPAPRGMCCAGDGGCFVYWRPFGAGDEVRLARLMQQEVILRAAFALGVQAQTGQRIFVATKLYSDAFGSAKEPVWATVKGEFAVQQVTTEGDHVMMRAVSVGTTPGVLKRLTGRDTAPATTGPEAKLDPLPGLKTWLQGTKHTGKVVGVEVVRKAVGR